MASSSVHAPGRSAAAVSSLTALSLGSPAYPSADPAEYSPLEAPLLPFSSSSRQPRRSRTHSDPDSNRPIGSLRSTRPHSTPSLATLASGSQPRRAPPSPRTRSDPAPSADGHREMHGRGLSDAQEELLVEARDDQATGTHGDNPYSWERPLDAVQRHSRMLEVSPVAATQTDAAGRRISRLPPGVQMLDPFGFSLAAEASPYDLALNASSSTGTPTVLSPSRSPVRASFLQPRVTPTTASSSSSHGHSPYPASGSIASNLSGASTQASSSSTLQPWTKPRAASAGEVYQASSRAQIKSGLLGPPPPVQRGTSSRSRLSKLSGEIEAEAETMSIASTASKAPQQLPAFVPNDSDYLNSKLYARTLKAQKALEKERAKAASKGKMSRYDSEAAKSTSSLTVPRSSMDTGRPASLFSVASAGKVRSARKSGLGWFRSSSEAALTLPVAEPPSAPSPPLPTSRSATTLPLSTPSSSSSPLPPSPNLASDPVLRSANSSSDYLREARENVASHRVSPPVVARQGSSSSSSSSDVGGPLPPPVRARPSPSSSFHHSPTIRETSPSRHDEDRSELENELALPPPRQPPTQALPTLPHPVPSQPPKRTASVDSRPTNASTTPTPPSPLDPPTPTAPKPPALSSVPARLSSVPPGSTSTPSSASSSRSQSPKRTTNGFHPPPPPRNDSHFSSQIQSQPPPPTQRSDRAPAQASQTSRHHAPSQSAPPALAPVSAPTAPHPPASVRASPALVVPDDGSGVRRRKSSMGLLFGSGRGSKNGGAASSSPGDARGAQASETARLQKGRRSEPRGAEASAPQAKAKEKVKEKVKESFFGRVKRPEMAPPPAPAKAAPAPAKVPAQAVPATRSAQPFLPRQDGFASSIPSRPTPAHAPAPPPGARAPEFQQYQYAQPPPSMGRPNSDAAREPRERSATAPDKAGRAPDSSSSNSTEFSTLSSSSSTLPPTPSSGRSTIGDGLSKSTNSASSKANGGGNAFSNFFGRHRTKSSSPATPPASKSSRSSKNTTPTPDDPYYSRSSSNLPVLPVKGQLVDRAGPTSKKPSGMVVASNGGGAERHRGAPIPSNGFGGPQRPYPTYA
ncbi:hypothetical protein JCM10212_002807 [Sporobolomyces blumeae]